MVKDPVCGKEIDEKNWLAGGADKRVYEGTTYYFCGLVCKQKFGANPEMYVAPRGESERKSRQTIRDDRR